LRIGREYKVVGGEINSQSLATVVLSSLVNANADVMLLHRFEKYHIIVV
jgi:CO dehydrogenase/acetyl-CoA synthase gamma subunit (corrinoid Fe-S protein)